MEIKYEFVKGKSVKVRVDKELGSEINSIRKSQNARNKMETRKHMVAEWEQVCDRPNADEMVEIEFIAQFRQNQIACLRAAMSKLNTDQQELLRSVFFNGVKPADIAREKGVTRQSMNDVLKSIYKKLRKELPKLSD